MKSIVQCVVSMANNMKIITATFIGTDGSMGYQKGRQYVLQVWHGKEPGILSALTYNLMKDHQIYIKRHPDPYNSLGVCPYANIETFLSNWTNIVTVKGKPMLPSYFIKPKNNNAKHYKNWSRKGNCPGCHVSCGSKHVDGCPVRKELLESL